MAKREFWVGGEFRVEVFRTTETVGNRYSMAGRTSIWKIRPSVFGVNGWSSRAGVHKFLSVRGLKKE